MKINPIKKIALWMIKFYAYCISPMLAPACRFQPSCSQYAQTAIERFGIWKGLRLTVGRIVRCTPGAEGGADPVPEIDAQMENPNVF